MNGGTNGFGSYRNNLASSHHYSHPYVPNGEPSQPLRAGYAHMAPPHEGSGESHYRHHSDTSSIASRSSTSIHGGQDCGPIPAPVIRSQYAEPVFQTFKERKRAKEEAMRAQAGSDAVYSSQASTVSSRTPPNVELISSRTPHDLGNRDSSVSHRVHADPLAPFSHGTSLASPGHIEPNPQSWSPALPPQMIPPPVRPSANRPLPSPVTTETSIKAGPSSPRSATSASARASAPILDRSDTVSSVKSLDRESGFGSPTKRPLPKPPVAVNSSKSLDRGIPSGIGGMGKSTLIGPAEGYSTGSSRRLPSTVTEVSEGSADESTPVTNRSSSRGPLPIEHTVPPVKILPNPVPSTFAPGIPAIVLPSDDDSKPISSMSPTVSVEPPSENEMRSEYDVPVIIEPPSSQPAALTPLPTISLGDSDADNVPTPNIGIAFADLPVIAVSSCDAAHVEPKQASEFYEGRSAERPSSASSMASSAGITRIDPTAAIICAGCTNPIIGRIVRAMDQRWHPQCFTCGECGEHLEHVSSYEYNRKPYCHLDYHDVSASMCIEQRFFLLIARNSRIAVIIAKPQLSSLALLLWTILCLASDTTMSFTSSALNVAILFSTPQSPRLREPNEADQTSPKRKRPTHSSSKRDIPIASVVICDCTSPNARVADRPFRTSHSKPWVASGIRSASFAQ